MGHTFLVIVDAFSKWVEVFPVSSTSAEATITALRMAFAQHGLPDLIVSDNGPAFASEQYLDFLTCNGIRRMLVPPYHPASNGAAERVVQTVKNKLKKSGSGDFQTRISRFLFHYRTTPHEVTGRAPCELLTGRMFKTPLDVLRPSLQSSVLLKQLKQKLYTDKGCRRGPPLNPEENVFARNFRQGMPWVPARVVGATSQSSAQVCLEDGTLWHRHGDHLRSRPTDSPTTAATAEAETCQPAGAAVQLEPQVLNKSQSASAPGALFEPGETSVVASDSVSSTGVTPQPTSIGPPQLRRSTRTSRAVQRYSP